MSGKHDRASELRAIADGRLLLNVRNGVTVSRSMLAMIADEIDAAEAQLAEARKALTEIDALDPEGHSAGCSADALRGLVTRMGGIARAALKEPSNG